MTIRIDHKPLLEIIVGTAKNHNTTAADKLCYWTTDILAGDPHPKIEYKKGSLNLIADSLSRLRTGEHYNHNFLLRNTEPIKLIEKNKVNMVTTWQFKTPLNRSCQIYKLRLETSSKHQINDN